MAGEDKYLQMLGRFFQDGHYTTEAVGIGGCQYIIEDYELTLVSCQHFGKGKTGSQINLFLLATGDIIKRDGCPGDFGENVGRFKGVAQV
jgi:hypothetical protein